MKECYKLIIALASAFLGALSAQAQSPAQGEALGYFRFVQATGIPGKITVLLDVDDLQPEGYTTGQCTGAIGFPAKTYQIKVHHPDLGDLRLALPLKPGSINTLVIFTKMENPKPDQSPKLMLSHYILESPAEDKAKGHNLTFVQCTSQPSVDFDVAGQPLSVARLTPVKIRVTKSMGEFPALSIGGTKLCTLNFKDPQDTVVIIFGDESGAMKAVSFGNAL